MAAKNAIPTIDLSPLRGGSGTEKREVARQIDAACTEIGFFIVTGHGISQDLITTARQQAIDFFAMPDEEKMKVQRPPAKISRGYNWVGDRSIAYSMGHEFCQPAARPLSPAPSYRAALSPLIPGSI